MVTFFLSGKGRFPLIVSKYANPIKNKALSEALASLIRKQAVEKVVVESSLAFYNTPSFSSSKTQQKMASNFGSEQTQSFPRHKHFQNGDPRDYKAVSSKRVGNFIGLQRCVLPYSYSSEVQEIPNVSPKQKQLPIHIPSLWFGNGPVGIHQSGQGGRADGSGKRYQNPPVPRRLVAESPVPGNLPTTYPDPLGPVPRVGLDSKLREIGTDPAASFRQLPVRSFDRSGLAHSGPVVFPAEEAQVHQGAKLLYSQTVHVPNRSSHSDRETSMVRSPSHEAHPVAPKATLACPRKSGKGHSFAQFSSFTSRLVVKQEKCASGPAFTPSSACSANVYRRLKRRLGCSLRGLNCKRRLVTNRKSPPHKLLELFWPSRVSSIFARTRLS